MPFKKNNTISNGRPKGSKDRISSKVREMFRMIIENNLEKFQEDLDSLKPKDRLDCIIRISPFVLPKLQTLEITELPTWMDLISMDREERKEYLIRMKNQMENGS